MARRLRDHVAMTVSVERDLSKYALVQGEALCVLTKPATAIPAKRQAPKTKKG